MKLRRLFQDRLGRRGVAAVEFALIIPVFLVLFIGTIEILTLYRTEAKLNALTTNIAQMIAITQSVSSTSSSNNGKAATVTSLKDICNGAILGLAPFPATGLKVNIASVTLEPSKANFNAPASTAAFDEWEQDYTESGGTCATSTGTAILSAAGAPPLSVATANSSTGNGTTTVVGTGMLEEPCDNIIIVQASLTYPGLTGLIVRSQPVLKQTAYGRWANASTLTQLLCANCTKQPATPKDFCNSKNTATN